MYKPVRDGVVHDPGRSTPYGGVTTACQYTYNLRYSGSMFTLTPAAEITTCVLCLNALPSDRGAWPPSRP